MREVQREWRVSGSSSGYTWYSERGEALLWLQWLWAWVSYSPFPLIFFTSNSFTRVSGSIGLYFVANLQIKIRILRFKPHGLYRGYAFLIMNVSYRLIITSIPFQNENFNYFSLENFAKWYFIYSMLHHYEIFIILRFIDMVLPHRIIRPNLWWLI